MGAGRSAGRTWCGPPGFPAERQAHGVLRQRRGGVPAAHDAIQLRQLHPAVQVGTMCAASPAKNSRPHCIGSATKGRMGVTDFWETRPVRSVTPS